MNPNQENLDFILKLPTKRLLRFFKSKRKEKYLYFDGYVGDMGWSDEEMDSISLDKEYKKYSHEWKLQKIKKYDILLNAIKKELNNRENID